MMHEGYEVLFSYVVADTGLVGKFDTEQEAHDAAKEYMRGYGLTGRYFIEGRVNGKIYPKHGSENEFHG
jgi:hypothetical protein